MAPQSTSGYESMLAPEDKDQVIVRTPYGTGLVVRTRSRSYPNGDNHVIMREIELTDWIQLRAKKGTQRPIILYSPTKFPSVSPKVGDDLRTNFGRGRYVLYSSDSVE
jgi:hypothetical protein